MANVRHMFYRGWNLHKNVRVMGLRKSWFMIYFIGIILTVALIYASDSTISAVMSEAVTARKHTIILDAGHGEPDGGAISCTGVPESRINLEITFKLRDIFHLMGYKTQMIRETDSSVYKTGDTIAQKKVSDLKERVRTANSTENAILISIHQNTFSKEQYYGAQVFYAPTGSSKDMADSIQKSLVKNLTPESGRKSKQGSGIYLLEHVNIPAVLIECGFISNRKEEALLRNAIYQQKISCVICQAICGFLSNT